MVGIGDQGKWAGETKKSDLRLEFWFWGLERGDAIVDRNMQVWAISVSDFSRSFQRKNIAFEEVRELNSSGSCSDKNSRKSSWC